VSVLETLDRWISCFLRTVGKTGREVTLYLLQILTVPTNAQLHCYVFNS